MKHIALLSACLVLSLQSFCQTQITQGGVFDPQFGIIKEHIAPKSKAIGSEYLYKQWKTGTIYLVNQVQFSGYPLNYDIKHHMVEIETKDGIKVIPGNKVAKLTIANKIGLDSTVLINCHSFINTVAPQTGFFEILQAGKNIQLIRLTSLEVIKSNYNAAMDVGSKSDRIVKKEKLFLVQNNEVAEFSKENLYTLFGSKKAAMKAYAKANKLKTRREEDVTKLIAHFNTLPE